MGRQRRYARIARAALACWFAANGPLKETHIFHADAAPPSQGGDAEIVLHEREASLRDQRGARALRIAIACAAGSTQVRISVIKLAPALAELMVSDVEVWAKGGAGCRARAFSPPQMAAVTKSSARTRASRDAQR
jgi:hypothetical protein